MNIEPLTASNKRIEENTVTYDKRRNTRVRDRLNTVCERLFREGAEGSPRKSPRSIKKGQDPSSPSIKRKGLVPTLRGTASRLFSRSSKNLDEPAAAPKLRTIARTGSAGIVWSISKINEAKARIKALFDDLAVAITKTTLSFADKKQRIATFIGALRVILEANVCHGDLKPENILWDELLFVICDFNGAISIDDVSALMHTEFIFESKEHKDVVRKLVYHLTDPVPKPLHGDNMAAIRLLIRWNILSPDARKSPPREAIFNHQKLQALKEYLATRFLPDSTRGYASDQYLNAMSNYFWRAEADNFALACKAFDIRSAALTIYACLTGTYPPKMDDDTAFYNGLQQSLQDIGVSKWAASVIRRMAEPKVPKLGDAFVLPVSIEELVQLQNEFHQQLPTSLPENEDNEAGVEKLSQIEKALLNLKLLSETEEGQIPLIVQNLKTQQMRLKEHEIPLDIRLSLIETAFRGYPDACEVTTVIDGRKYTTVLLLDPSTLSDSDVVIRQETIGVGGSATAYKALSLRSLRTVVLKYFQELANPQEANNANARLAQIGGHEGIQSKPDLYRLQRNEDYKQVAVEPYYKNCDFASCVFGDLFCSRWGIPKEHTAVRKQLEAIDLQEEFSAGAKSVTEKLARLDAFCDEYGKTFTGIFGEEKTTGLFDDYRTLIYSTPKMEASGSLSPLLKRSTGELTELITKCTTKCITQCYEWLIIDKAQLQQTIKSHPNLETRLKEAAKELMVTTIRTCQAEVIREHAHNSATQDNPLTLSKDWLKRATIKAFGDTHLDLKGINHISKRLGIDIVVTANPKGFQNDLLQLTTIFADTLIA